RRIGIGMGEVYEAEHGRLKRRVAVKIIRRGRSSPPWRERFLREQQVLARVHHTHVVPIHTAGEADPFQYFVMPFIEGVTLHHAAHTIRHLAPPRPGSPPPSLKDLAPQVASPFSPAGLVAPAPSRPEAVPAASLPPRPAPDVQPDHLPDN